MTTHLEQRIPGGVEKEPEFATVETLDDLVSVPFIARQISSKNFYRLSVSSAPGEKDRLLMMELHEGYTWFVLAYLRGDPLPLPAWEPKYKRTTA